MNPDSNYMMTEELDEISSLVPCLNGLALNEPVSEPITHHMEMVHRMMNAEDLAAEAMAADHDPWIIYDPDDKTGGSLEEWLETYRPSEISRDDNVGWIYVQSPIKLADEDEGDVIGLQAAWEEYKASNAPVTYEKICDLALGYNKTVGKWLFHVDTGCKVDIVWRVVATHLIRGSLGQYATCAKVSPVNPESRHQYKHVICIYNRNFTNEAEVFALENELRASGIKCQMKYKPDVYTYCGVYVNNNWGLRPTIYSSSYDIGTLSSTIQNLRTLESKTMYIGPQKKLFLN